LSLMGGFPSSAVLSIVAVGCLSYFFAAPVFNFKIQYSLDAVVVISFLITSLIVTGLVRRARSLREQLRLVIDTIPAVVWSKLPDGSADFFNQRFREYTGLSLEEGQGWGWMNRQAVGNVSHHLLQTSFPDPLGEIMATLLQTRRWEGELVHTKRDGTQVIVASRWALQQDEHGRPVAILETNNDISERKQAEEALRRQANLLEQTHDAILVWRFPGTIIYWSR